MNVSTLEVQEALRRSPSAVIPRRVSRVNPDSISSALEKVMRLIRFMREFHPDWEQAYRRHLLDGLDTAWDDTIATLPHEIQARLGLVVALSERPEILLSGKRITGLEISTMQGVLQEMLSMLRAEIKHFQAWQLMRQAVREAAGAGMSEHDILNVIHEQKGVMAA